MKNPNSIDIESLQKELESWGMPALRERFALHYGYTPQTRKKAGLVNKILWAVQRDAYGDISLQAREKAQAIADDRDVRERFAKAISVPQTGTNQSVTLSYKPEPDITPGTILQRHYRGRNIRVLVLEEGFEFEGRYFKSLSAIAREVTQTRWNGRRFFNLYKKGVA